jgi:hypothetical protein
MKLNALKDIAPSADGSPIVIVSNSETLAYTLQLVHANNTWNMRLIRPHTPTKLPITRKFRSTDALIEYLSKKQHIHTLHNPITKKKVVQNGGTSFIYCSGLIGCYIDGKWQWGLSYLNDPCAYRHYYDNRCSVLGIQCDKHKEYEALCKRKQLGESVKGMCVIM